MTIENLHEIEEKFQQVGLEIFASRVDVVGWIQVYTPLAATGVLLCFDFNGDYWKIKGFQQHIGKIGGDFFGKPVGDVRHSEHHIKWPNKRDEVGLLCSWYGWVEKGEVVPFEPADPISDDVFWKGLKRHLVR